MMWPNVLMRGLIVWGKVGWLCKRIEQPFVEKLFDATFVCLDIKRLRWSVAEMN
jgi:hypothetical protein